MKSKWYHLKDEAIALRQSGMSMTTIERRLGIPRSTLSLWLREVILSDQQKEELLRSKADGWAKARVKAVEVHRAQKSLRLLEAKRQAEAVMLNLDLSNEVLDLALAMLYYGEGAKNDRTSLANSDPNILRFFLTVLRHNYGLTVQDLRCDLHLRADQDANQMRRYWSEQLSLPIECFRYVAFDKRTAGRATYDHYKGVCVITCNSIAIQRKLTYLYTLFCDKVAGLNLGT